MEQLTVQLKIYYNDGKPPKVESISLWHGHKPFLFVDDKTVYYIIVANRRFNTQEEYNAFFYGIERVRNILISLANY